MNISTLAKILGVSISELRSTGSKNQIYGFYGRNTRIPYKSAAAITQILRPEKLAKLKNDDKIYLPSSLTVQELAESINRPAGKLIKALLLNGVIVSLNEKIDYDTAVLISQELGVEVFPENQDMFDKASTDDLQMVKMVEYDTPESEKKYISRNPVVTIMGHVDHGKTTLLDTIRKSNVVDNEAGSITQHISSYQTIYKDKKITFVDTPGHEAFTAMRARGSQLADFIIIVVSAVEGPKPQTVEVIERAKLSKTPTIVAINKIDLPEADVEKVKQAISKYGMVPEDWGGHVPFIPISAKNNLNIDKLLETILFHTEVAELKGEVECPGQAVVIESNLDQKLGVASTVLVVKDKIKVGDIIRCGEYVGKVRKLENSTGQSLNQAEIGEPVRLIGLPEVVEIGESIIVYKTQKAAQNEANLAHHKKSKKRIFIPKNNSSSEESIKVVIKADVSGSAEALKESLYKIPQEKVKIVIKNSSVGQITESDIEFAKTAEATILAFNTSVLPRAENLLKREKVNIIQSSIIYEILKWVEDEIIKNTKHETKDVKLGQAKVLSLFKSPKSNLQIIGGEVTDGKIVSNKMLKIWREGQEVGQVEILELQRNKSKTKEVNISQQFGVSVTPGKPKIQKGDIIESFDEVLIS